MRRSAPRWLIPSGCKIGCQPVPKIRTLRGDPMSQALPALLQDYLAIAIFIGVAAFIGIALMIAPFAVAYKTVL